ncbi:MAG: hypothetical protein IT378_17075 [Sandaracinaceae bacterium]|nr:hypothetical protein [Sandaracinaceae bacterium]
MSRAPDVEWIAFASGLKPALRLLGPARMPPGVARVEAAAPLGGKLVYVAAERALAERLRELEAPILPGAPALAASALLERHRELGRLLGYPRCCVDAFLERLERGARRRARGGEADEDFVAAEDALARTRTVYARAQFLLRKDRIFLLSHYPCAFDCELSLRYASALFERLPPARAAALREASMRAVWILPSGERAQAGRAGALAIVPASF